MPEQMQKKHKKHGILDAGIVVLIALFFMLFIYAPVELFCYNKREFWFDLRELIPIMLGLFLVGLGISVMAVWVLERLLPKIYHAVVFPVICITFVCTYIQGTFLVNDLPPLDGSVPDWNDYMAGRIQSLLLWLVVSLVIVVVYRKWKAERFAVVAKYVSICMMLMLSVTMVSILLTTKGYQKKLDVCATTKD